MRQFLHRIAPSTLLLCVFIHGATVLRAQCWTATGDLGTARANHAMFVLADGRVLAAGELNTGMPVTNGAELYDPTTGMWSPTASTTLLHTDPTAVRLADGRIMLTGGRFGSTPLNTVEIYDPATGTWSSTGQLNSARVLHSATLLADGRVLVAGGFGAAGFLSSAEIYDPITGTWSYTASLPIGRWQHSATLLTDGRVLVAGGENYSFCPTCSLKSSYLYNPVTGTWSSAGDLNQARGGQGAVRLSDGSVLNVAGITGASARLASAESYNPLTNQWTLTGSLAVARSSFSTSLMADGSVVAAGGLTAAGAEGSVELYVPSTGLWTTLSPMINPRGLHAAVVLPDGRLLISGGYNGGSIKSSEIYETANHPPSAAAGPDQNLVADASCGATVVLDGQASSDPDGCDSIVSYTWTGPFGSVSGKKVSVVLASGSHAVQLVVVDGQGASSSDEVIVDIDDNSAPVFVSVPPPVVVDQTGCTGTSVVLAPPSVTDNCGSFTVTNDAPDVFPLGTTVVTFTAVDLGGNTATASTTVEVFDRTAPVPDVPALPTIQGECLVSVSAPTAHDCDTLIVATTVDPTSYDQQGTYTITWVYTDASGNTSQQMQTVVVEDTTAPAAWCQATTNPSGKNEPRAGNNPKSGQNPDGFYELFGEDNCTTGSSLKIFVKDSASNFVAGPYAPGTKVKITQAPGVIPNEKKMAGDIAAHIQLKGDAMVYAVDAAGNQGTPHACLVPPAPK